MRRPYLALRTLVQFLQFWALNDIVICDMQPTTETQRALQHTPAAGS